MTVPKPHCVGLKFLLRQLNDAGTSLTDDTTMICALTYFQFAEGWSELEALRCLLPRRPDLLSRSSIRE